MSARLSKGRGHEQDGARPVIVLQTDAMATWSTVVIAPLSSSAQPADFRPPITVKGRTTRVMVDQLRTLDVTRLGKRIGAVDASELLDIEVALKRVLGLS
jgi:mRNA interferase MazF